MRIRWEQALGLVGAILWAATIFLRGTVLMDYAAPRFVLGIAPNIGAVWVAYDLALLAVRHLVKGGIKPVLHCCIIGAVLVLLLASEIVHDVFLQAPFDIWDMAASCVAALVLLFFLKLRGEAGQGDR